MLQDEEEEREARREATLRKVAGAFSMAVCLASLVFLPAVVVGASVLAGLGPGVALACGAVAVMASLFSFPFTYAVALAWLVGDRSGLELIFSVRGLVIGGVVLLAAIPCVLVPVLLTQLPRGGVPSVGLSLLSGVVIGASVWIWVAVRVWWQGLYVRVPLTLLASFLLPMVVGMGAVVAVGWDDTVAVAPPLLFSILAAAWAFRRTFATIYRAAGAGDFLEASRWALSGNQGLLAGRLMIEGGHPEEAAAMAARRTWFGDELRYLEAYAMDRPEEAWPILSRSWHARKTARDTWILVQGLRAGIATETLRRLVDAMMPWQPWGLNVGYDVHKNLHAVKAWIEARDGAEQEARDAVEAAAGETNRLYATQNHWMVAEALRLLDDPDWRAHAEAAAAGVGRAAGQAQTLLAAPGFRSFQASEIGESTT